MGSCWVTVGSVLLALGVVLGITTLFAPYWVRWEVLGGAHYQGLWGECDKDSCNFWFDEERTLKSRPDYFKATQALYSIGVISLVAAELIVVCYACCRACQGSIRVTQGLIALLVIAAIALGIAVTVYGAKTDQHDNIFSKKQLFWGFYLAVATAICAVVAAVIFLMETCTLRR